MIAPQAGPTTSENWWQAAQLQAAKAIFDYEMSRLNVDSDRVLIAGQSMGGYGSYEFTERYPDVPSAVAPISGGWGNYNNGNPATANYPADMSPWDHIPYWIFHGQNDTTVRPSCAQQAFNQMTADGIHTKYTLYHNQTHHPRGHVYSSQTFYDWAFSQERGTPHNYEMSVNDGSGVSIIGFFESGTGHSITGRSPDSAGGEVFRGWTASNGVIYEDTGGPKTTITSPTNNTGSFADANALTTTFTMGDGDVIVTANYLIALANQPVSDISADSAMVNADLDATGSNFNMTVYWGTADGGTDPDAWGDNEFVGSWTDTTESLSHQLSLLPGTDYYYSFRATNGCEDIWGGTIASFAAVPEPSTLTLLTLGLTGLLRRRRRNLDRNFLF